MLIILKLEESEFVSDTNLQYLRSVKNKFNGLSISRGDLYCNHGNNSPIYEAKLLKFAREENIPIRVVTMIGENYIGVFSRNDLFCLYSYICNGLETLNVAKHMF